MEQKRVVYRHTYAAIPGGRCALWRGRFNAVPDVFCLYQRKAEVLIVEGVM